MEKTNLTGEAIKKKYGVGPGDDGYMNALMKEKEFLSKNKNNTPADDTMAKGLNNRKQVNNTYDNEKKNKQNKKPDIMSTYLKNNTFKSDVEEKGLGGAILSGLFN